MNSIEDHTESTKSETIEKVPFLVTPQYIKQMQVEAAFAKMNNEPPEFPDDVYYMTAYHQS